MKPGAETDGAADAVAAAAAFLDAQRIPRFRIAPPAVSVVETPSGFRAELLEMVGSARRRVVVASLYMGKDEVDLIRAIESRLAAVPNFTATFLVDFYRGSRGFEPLPEEQGKDGKNGKDVDYVEGRALSSGEGAEFSPMDTVELISILAKRFPGRVNLSLYRTPAMANDWLASLLPPRFNEVVGLQHMKVYVADNSAIVSGANLNKDYFTDRQDRYILYRDHQGLADYYKDLVSTVSKFSFPVAFDTQIAAKAIRAHGTLLSPAAAAAAAAASDNKFFDLDLPNLDFGSSSTTGNNEQVEENAEANVEYTDTEVLNMRSESTKTLFERPRDGRIVLDPPILTSQVVRTKFGTYSFRALAKRSLEQFNEKWYVWTTSRRHFTHTDLTESIVKGETWSSRGSSSSDDSTTTINSNNNDGKEIPSSIAPSTYSSINEYHGSSRNGTVTIYPLLQMGEFNIYQEEEVMSGLFHKLIKLSTQDSLIPPTRLGPSAANVEEHINQHRYQLFICSGYLNFTKEFLKTILDFTHAYGQSIARLREGIRSNALNAPPIEIKDDPQAQTTIVTSSPRANGFFGSKGVSRFLPAAYTFLECKLLKTEKRYTDAHFANKKPSAPSPLELLKSIPNLSEGKYDFNQIKSKLMNHGFKVEHIKSPAILRQYLASESHDRVETRQGLVNTLEYCRPGWTWHAKGLWLIGSRESVLGSGTTGVKWSDPTVSNSSNSFLTVIGSSNYGYRSQRRDLECQLIMIAQREPELTRRIGRNLYDILLRKEHVTPVTLNSLRVDPQRRVPFLVACATRLVRKLL